MEPELNFVLIEITKQDCPRQEYISIDEVILY